MGLGGERLRLTCAQGSGGHTVSGQVEIMVQEERK